MASFKKHLEVWDELGSSDPLWAIASLPDTRGNRWEMSEFLKTGETDVSRYREVLGCVGVPGRYRHVLDFGCGVGRLSIIWSKYADQVTGVDVSRPMIEQAEVVGKERPNVTFLHNANADLALLPDNTFDLVFSHACLQHIHWDFAKIYLREFARVTSAGGVVVFQLPSRALNPNRGAAVRAWIVEHLPFGLGKKYRRWRHGSATVFEMHLTPVTDVRTTCLAAGLSEPILVHDRTAGETIESFIYVFRKKAVEI